MPKPGRVTVHVEVDKSLWMRFRMVALGRGLTAADALKAAISDSVAGRDAALPLGVGLQAPKPGNGAAVKPAHFVTPTTEEVRAFVNAKNIDIDPEEFISKMRSVGWVDKNGNRIKDWKATLHYWARRRAQ